MCSAFSLAPPCLLLFAFSSGTRLFQHFCRFSWFALFFFRLVTGSGGVCQKLHFTLTADELALPVQFLCQGSRPGVRKWIAPSYALLGCQGLEANREGQCGASFSEAAVDIRVNEGVRAPLTICRMRQGNRWNWCHITDEVTKSNKQRRQPRNRSESQGTRSGSGPSRGHHVPALPVPGREGCQVWNDLYDKAD